MALKAEKIVRSFWAFQAHKFRGIKCFQLFLIDILIKNALGICYNIGLLQPQKEAKMNY